MRAELVIFLPLLLMFLPAGIKGSKKPLPRVFSRGGYCARQLFEVEIDYCSDAVVTESDCPIIPQGRAAYKAMMREMEGGTTTTTTTAAPTRRPLYWRRSDSQSERLEPNSTYDSRNLPPQAGEFCNRELRPDNLIIEYNGYKVCCQGAIYTCYGCGETHAHMATGDKLERRVNGCMDDGVQQRWVRYYCTDGCEFWKKKMEPAKCRMKTMNMQ